MSATRLTVLLALVTWAGVPVGCGSKEAPVVVVPGADVAGDAGGADTGPGSDGSSPEISDPDATPTPADCLTVQAYFQCGVWDPFMGSTCFGCHQPGGPGALGSEFDLLPPGPGYMDDNLKRVETIAQKTSDGESVLLNKARGVNHGGGLILPADSPEYANLVALLSYFDDPGFCRSSCDTVVELIEEPDELCSSEPVTAQLNAAAALQAPAIYTQRLTHWQYRGSVRVAFDSYFDDIGDLLPPDSTTGTIPSNENFDLPTADYKRYAKAAAHVADELMLQADEDLDDLFGCDGPRDRDCAEGFVTKRGRRLLRRPLSAEEVESYLEIYDIGAGGGGSFEEGLQYVIEALLLSPDFLYQVEIGPTDSTTAERLSGLEIATRLSFFLHARPPSVALLDAALAGELDDDAGVESWVDTLLSETDARWGIQQFILRWLRMDDAHAVEKDSGLYPGFTGPVLTGLRRGAQLWAAYTVLEGDGLLETLFSAAETVVRLEDKHQDKENAFWNATEDDIIATSPRFGDVVALPEGERAGLLTSPPRLANVHNSDDTGTRPILRGAALLTNVLCGDLEPPQAFEPPGAVEGESVKDSISFMLNSPGCAGCHNVLNPLGLAFESYDAVGAYRHDQLDDLGFPIETWGSFGVDGVCSDETAPFEDAVTLIKTLSTNERLRACATIQWFRYGLRRGPRLDGSDAGNLADIYERFSDSSFNVRALLKAIVLSRPFLYRTFGDTEGTP